MDKDILITFVVDVHYKIKEDALKKYSKKIERLYNKIDILIDLNIVRKINHKHFYSKFICSTEPIKNNNKLEYQRLYITYEAELGCSSFFVHKVKEKILTIFISYIDNEILQINLFELMNEKINYDYYKEYWTTFTLVSDSPRLYSPRIKKIIFEE